MKPTRQSLQILIGSAIVSQLLYAVIAWTDNLSQRIPFFLLAYGLLFILYAFTAVQFFKLQSPKSSENRIVAKAAPQTDSKLRWLNFFQQRVKKEHRLPSKEIVIIGFIFAVVFRLTMLFSTPSLSDDIYRYVWDGRVSTHGINPYLYAPQAPELSPLRDNVIYPNINHKEIPTIYPPVLQLIFKFLYRIEPTLFFFKSVVVLFDLLTIGLLFLILQQFRLPPVQSLIYAWNPLVIVEFAGSGHVDIIGIFFLLLSFFFLIRMQWAKAVIILVFSFLTKFFAGIFLPVIVFLKKESKLLVPLLFLIVCGIFYLPYIEAGEQIFAGLRTFADKWRFNSPVFSIVFATVKSILPEKWIIDWMITPYGYAPDAATLSSRGTDLALLISKGLMALIFGVIYAYYFLRLNKDLEKQGRIWLFKSGVILLGAFVLLSPTIHPWYIAWVLPLAVIVVNRAWVLLSGLVMLSYWILIDYNMLGMWEEKQWVSWVEYLPFFVLLIYDSLTRKSFKNEKRISHPDMAESSPHS